MTTLREDARRALSARRERVFATPAPIATPVISTIVVAAITALVLVLLDVSTVTLAIALGAIALVAAFGARRTTFSLLAGAVLWLVRPYRSGERIRLYAPERCAVVDAEVVRIGPLNTVLLTDTGVLVVANARMLRAAPECS